MSTNLAEWIHGSMVYQRRSAAVASWFAELTPTGADVLDVGCGDGGVAATVMALRPDVRIRGIDVLVRPHTLIPVQSFDGHTLPFGDQSLDVVSFIDVLHHVDDPEQLLREAARVARSAVLIKDHTLNGLLAGSRLRLMDWVGNRRHGVRLPYNYWPENRWRETFTRLGLAVERWESALGLYSWPLNLVFGRGLHLFVQLRPKRDGVNEG